VRGALAIVVVAVAACPGSPSKGPAETAYPTDFTPPPKLGAPPPSDPRAFGSAYLERVYDGIVEPWTQFLEDCRRRLPPAHPLNDPSLVATAELTIDPSGVLVALAIAGSGTDDFDAAVGGVVRDRAPYPRPDAGLLSDDGRLHLRWRFARDVRQAGVAGAEVVVVEWGIERAVPKLLAEGKVGEAARRIARATGDGARAELAETVFAAAIAEGVESGDAEARRLAVEVATRTPVPAAVAALRARAAGAVDPGVRAGTLIALAVLGDPETTELCITALHEGPAAGLPVVIAAATALDRIGRADVGRPFVGGWLSDANRGVPGARAASFAALAVLPADILLDIVIAQAAEDARSRAAACPVYGRAAAQGVAPYAARAWTAITAGLRDADAGVRAACAAAAATAGAAGATDKKTAGVVAARLVDRDLAVRAAAIVALARLDAARATGELRALGKETSPVVLAALANAWSRLPKPPVDRLRQLAAHPDPDVRAAAVAGLIRIDAPAAIEAAAAGAADAAAAVRLAAIPAVRDDAVLVRLTRDPEPAVSAAADEALIALRGRAASLEDRLTVVATAAPGSVIRVRAAASWLLAR
jgi:hypothetical protein